MKTVEKKKETKVDHVFEYDATAEQSIPMTLEKNRKSYRVSHKFKPLSNARFISLEKEKEAIKKTVSKSQTAVLQPTANLWDDLIIDRVGYSPTDDIRKKTHLMDKVKAIIGLLYANIVDVPSPSEQAEVLDSEFLFDDDEANEIKLEVMQSGVLITTTHYFRQETQEEMDEYLSIITNSPAPNKLASMSHKLSTVERVIALYDETHIKHYGYKDGTEVPAWHKVPAVMYFFAQQFSRMD